MVDWQVVNGGVTAPKGYRAAGIVAGLKPSGAPDLALILSDTEAIAAGVFTTTQVRLPAWTIAVSASRLKPAPALFCVMLDRQMPPRVNKAGRMP